jgi:hypothetical protein
METMIKGWRVYIYIGIYGGNGGDDDDDDDNDDDGVEK